MHFIRTQHLTIAPPSIATTHIPAIRKNFSLEIENVASPLEYTSSALKTFLNNSVVLSIFLQINVMWLKPSILKSDIFLLEFVEAINQPVNLSKYFFNAALGSSIIE
jgi:hypothetical protein